MNTIKTLIALTAALSLAACGGGGSSEELEPALAATPIATAYGDATFLAPEGQKSAIDYAAEALGRPIINKATGDTRSNANDVHYLQILEAKNSPAVVLLGWGINDQVAAGDIIQIIGAADHAVELKKAGKIPVFVESTPIVPGGVLSDAVNQWGRKWLESGRLETEAIKRSAAAQYGAHYCAMPARSWTLADKPDGITLSNDAAKWLGSVIAACIADAAK
jgi:hypothetical protein